MPSTRLLRHSAPIAVLVSLCASYSMSLHAQSVDDCLSAGQTEAIAVCKTVIAGGSLNVDVFWKLSNAQHQNGEHVQANKTLDKALEFHPGNVRLISLQKIIAASSTEQKLLIRSTKVNQRSVDKGAVKIACLSKTGPEAILACQQRLSLTDEDGDRIRARLTDLQSEQEPTLIATAPETDSNPKTLPVPAPTASVVTATTKPSIQPSTRVPETDAAQLAQDARKKANKNLVAEVQTILNDLGFTAGLPDGVPGDKTRSALFEFYTTIGEPVSTSITAATLEDLTQEQRKLVNAQQLLKRSVESIQQGSSELSAEQLANARTTSRLLRVPEQHEQSILTAQNETQPEVKPAITETANQIVAPTADGESSERFNTLMGQIEILQTQITRKQADQAQQFDRMRNIL